MPHGFVRSTRKWREVTQSNGHDDAAPDPTAGGSPDQIEAVLRRAFDLPAGGMAVSVVPGPSPGSVSVELSDALTKLVWDLCGGVAAKERVEKVVCRLLNEKMGKVKTAGGPLEEAIAWLRDLASAPFDTSLEVDRLRERLILARRAMFVPVERLAGEEELPYTRKNQRGRPPLYRNSSVLANASEEITMEESKCCCSLMNSSCIHCQCDNSNRSKKETEMLYGHQPRRRSERALGLLKLCGGDVLRKRIPVGPFFQADIPDWTGPSNSNGTTDDDQKCESQWLGTQLWPTENNRRARGRETVRRGSTEAIGRGRPDFCSCSSPNSTMCTRYHVRMSRIQLKNDLGRAFVDMGFHNMGEEVACLWSWDQQRVFDNIVQLNPISELKTFWYHALESFPSKRREEIVSFYFNVYVLRRMCLQTKLPRESIDSDDDEWNKQIA